MFLNVDEASRIYMSAVRAYMALLMVSPMAMLMLLLMGNKYPDKRKNASIKDPEVKKYRNILSNQQEEEIV